MSDLNVIGSFTGAACESCVFSTDDPADAVMCPLGCSLDDSELYDELIIDPADMSIRCGHFYRKPV